ncbi:MAG TPA: SidA/IucD/PvdA family monooxygenase [Actinophytocola sp.]|uniref:lysine N(6)-hydroxylase/L-ornithine N(5)-oxygenase family protein n=1 Tax=Actinophytocola sp. TaxID=1872138 RepID=UPI002DBAC332|nr:SidA/IucD/PvdA family monooxygenase [Actinophytocola sp.]HEU5471312.1 SidA/IucD/PvdA family monooxygenase [Actinophytocola sp.]
MEHLGKRENTVRYQEVELLAIGAGPSSLALAVAVEELARTELAGDTLIVEQQDDVVWQRGMLMPWTQSQVSFLKDLVTLRNPRSAFTFVNYLHSVGRLDQFINLGSFTPYRMEISGYLGWVARSLPNVRIEYGRRCVSVRPFGTADGAGEWIVQLADGGIVVCRHLVIAAGRDAYIPEIFAGIPRELMIHSTEFAARIGEIDPDRTRRIAVIGGAQSAAEMLWTAHQAFPQARCTMVMRSIGLNAYETSRFTNELFYPSFVDEFHSARPEAREQLLREMHRTNYAGLTPDMLDTLYRAMYVERLTGAERIEMIPMVDVTAAELDGREVVLTLADRKSGRRSQLRSDVLLLGTGFAKKMPWIVRDMADSVGIDQITVNRSYRMDLPPSFTGTCHLQGVNEATHGIADSLLSVLSARAEEIVTDLLAHRRAPAPFTGVRATRPLAGTTQGAPR